MNLPDYLKSLGYVEVPLTVTRTNHIVVKARVNGEGVILAVDTGASRTCIAESSAKRLRLASGGVQQTGSLTLPRTTAALSNLERLEVGPLLITDVEA